MATIILNNKIKKKSFFFLKIKYQKNILRSNTVCTTIYQNALIRSTIDQPYKFFLLLRR